MRHGKDIERLFRQHYDKMYRLAMCILYDEAESKDVVSEVFSKILANHIVLLPESEEGYLKRSVRNCCLNVIARKDIREKVAKQLLTDSDAILSEQDDERLSILRNIIDGLEPPVRQQIVRLRYQQEMSYQEIADKVGVSKVTVYNHLSQAMNTIRQRLSKALL